jgi:hypothetical protein
MILFNSITELIELAPDRERWLDYAAFGPSQLQRQIVFSLYLGKKSNSKI